MNRPPVLFIPSRSPAIDPRPGPPLPTNAAIMAMLDEEDCESGGINSAVDVYWLGIRNAIKVAATRPIPIARRNNRRWFQNRRNRWACRSGASSKETSGPNKTSPSAGTGEILGDAFIAVCVTVFFRAFPVAYYRITYFGEWGQKVICKDAVTSDFAVGAKTGMSHVSYCTELTRLKSVRTKKSACTLASVNVPPPGMIA